MQSLSFDIRDPLPTPAYFSAREWLERREQDQGDHGTESDEEVTPGIPDDCVASAANQVPPSTDLDSGPISPPVGLNRTQKKNWINKQKHNIKRAEVQAGAGSRLKECTQKHIRGATRHVLKVNCSLQDDFKPSQPAWIGKCDQGDWKVYDPRVLTAPDGPYQMTLIKWDGK